MARPGAYAQQIASTRRLALIAAGLDLLVVGLVAHGQAGVWADRDLARLIGFEVAFAALLVGYAALLGPKPRPWLSAAVAAAVLVDQVLWIGPETDGHIGPGPAGLCFGPALALALVFSLLRTAWAERQRLREQPAVRSARGGALALAALAWAGAAFAAVERPSDHLAVRRWKQGEVAACREDLRRWYLAEKSFRLKEGRYTERLGDLAFQPSRPGNTIDASASPNSLAHLAGGASLGLQGTCPDCEIAATCANRVYEEEDSLDVWSVSTRDRLLPGGQVVRAGVPFHERDGMGLE